MLSAGSADMEPPAPKPRSIGGRLQALGTVGHHTLPHSQLGLEKLKGHFLLIDSQYPSVGEPSYCTLADLGEDPSTGSLVLLVNIPTYDPVSFRKQIKLTAITEGDGNNAEKISVPMPALSSSGQQAVGGTGKVFPVLRGDRTTPKDVPFQWHVLSGLCQLATKYGLGSLAVASMLRFLTANEKTPFDTKQIAKLCCTPAKYMMFESTWQWYAEDQSLQNLEVLQHDPHFGVGVSQLMGLPPVETLQLQAHLHSLILAQAKELGIEALMKVADMATLTQRYSRIKGILRNHAYNS